MIILVRSRIPRSVPLINGSGPDFFLHGCKFFLFFFIFSRNMPHAHHRQSKKFSFLLQFSVKCYFERTHYFSKLNTFMRKGKDPEPDQDPYL
jgi:hypothetical protein